jgi:hypothetical protein
MKTTILKEIVYESAGEFEIHTVNDRGVNMNYFVKAINETTPTRQQLESLKGKTITFIIDKINYTGLFSSINIRTN